MKRERTTLRGQLRGYMFEVVVRVILEHSGFSRVKQADDNKIRMHNENGIEIMGRGTWHQIDCPCISEYKIPFIYDLRILAEVKFYTKEIQKDKIREYIGTIKDISENYFVANEASLDNANRYTDIGVYFSANGFQLEAEKLAFAHNIKTVSYRNNRVIDVVKRCIEDLEKDYLCASVLVSKGNRLQFQDVIYNFLKSDSEPINTSEWQIPLNAIALFSKMRESIQQIKTSFLGTTITNQFLHFISESPFPNYLFDNTDERYCRIHYNGNNEFFLEIDGDASRGKFYFSAPPTLLKMALTGSTEILDAKEQHFQAIKVCLRINDIQRSIVLKINPGWINTIRNHK